MSTVALTFYVLIWPAIAAIVLAVLVGGVVKDILAARRGNDTMV